MNHGWGISYEIVLRWMPLDLTDDKSALVHVMAWCHQATSHYLSQCWPSFMSPYGVARPQWVKAMRAQLSLKAVLPLAKRIAIASNRCNTGPRVLIQWLLSQTSYLYHGEPYIGKTASFFYILVQSEVTNSAFSWSNGWPIDCRICLSLVLCMETVRQSNTARELRRR